MVTDWNAALEKVLHMIRVRQAQWPKFSTMYASLEDVARDCQALKQPDIPQAAGARSVGENIHVGR